MKSATGLRSGFGRFMSGAFLNFLNIVLLTSELTKSLFLYGRPAYKRVSTFHHLLLMVFCSNLHYAYRHCRRVANTRMPSCRDESIGKARYGSGCMPRTLAPHTTCIVLSNTFSCWRILVIFSLRVSVVSRQASIEKFQIWMWL